MKESTKRVTRSLKEPIFGWKQWHKSRNELTAKYNKASKLKYLYLIESDNGLYKIGISKDPRKRLSQLITSSGYDARLISFYLTRGDASQVERRLHKLFDVYRQKGEWFKFPDTYTLEKFETLCDKYGMIPQVFEVDANGKILYEEEINRIAIQQTRRESTQEWIDRTNREWEENKNKDEKV